MHYLIKQEKCDKCDGNGGKRPSPHAEYMFACHNCNGVGYIETRVDADEWLREKLREFADEK